MILNKNTFEKIFWNIPMIDGHLFINMLTVSITNLQEHRLLCPKPSSELFDLEKNVKNRSGTMTFELVWDFPKMH